MKKNHIRDYATAAFRFHARTKGGCEGYKKTLWDEAIERHRKLEERAGERYEPCSPSEAAITRAEEELEKHAAEIADLDAVEKVINEIEQVKYVGHDMIRALRLVYMTDPEREPEKGEISDRVHKAELEIPASEKTIYRWLSIMRDKFADARGLRTSP